MPNKDDLNWIRDPLETVITRVYTSSLDDHLEILLDDNDPDKKSELSNFLQKTKLKDFSYQFESTEVIRLQDNTGKSVSVSGRMPSAFELRGKNLLDILEAAKESNPENTLAEALNRRIKGLEVAMIKPGVTEGSTAVMTPEEFDLLMQKTFERLEQIPLLKSGTATAAGETLSEHVKNILSESMRGLEALSLIEHFSQQLNEKLENWNSIAHKRGYIPALNQVNALKEFLTKEKDSLMDGNLDAKLDQCIKAIESTEKTLGQHRGFFGKIFHQILQGLNKLTGGRVDVKATDSMQKTTAMKELLRAQKSDSAAEQETDIRPSTRL